MVAERRGVEGAGALHLTQACGQMQRHLLRCGHLRREFLPAHATGVHAVADELLRHIGHQPEQRELAEQKIVFDQVFKLGHDARRSAADKGCAIARTQGLQAVEAHGDGGMRHRIAEQHGRSDARRMGGQRVLRQGAPLVVEVGELAAERHRVRVGEKSGQGVAQAVG